MPSFDSKTGLPYGSVNLRHGVNADETTVASLAGAGSLSLEFMLLSELTHEPSYGCAARKVRAIKKLVICFAPWYEIDFSFFFFCLLFFRRPK